MGPAEPGDRRMIRPLIGGDHPEGHIPPAQPLDPSARPRLQTIRIPQQRPKYGQCIGRLPPAIPPDMSARFFARSIWPHRIQDEPGQIVHRQSSLQRRGQQRQWSAITRQNVVAHRLLHLSS
jgi:hypothetical protein